MSNSVSRLLVAVSSPWAARKLSRPIGQLAKRLNAEVFVLHVARLMDADEEEADAENRGQRTLEELEEALNAEGVACRTSMAFEEAFQDPARLILDTAEQEQCTCIAMGLAGGPSKRLATGDVPAQIVRMSQIPVLLLPADWHGDI